MNNRKPILLLALLGLSASALAQQPNALAPMQSIYAQARPATVKIVTEDGFGSGFFYSQGYVLTAYHVVEGTSEVKLQTPDQQTLTAQTVGYAQSYDLAVLKVEGHVSAHFLGLDTQRSPEPGEWVLTIGSSRGELSAPRLGRIEDTRVNLSPLFPKDLVASSMPLAPGDSGGAVLDADGQVVGVAVAVGVDAAGQPHSYFVPLDGLGQLLQALAQGSSTRWPVLGVLWGVALDETLAASLDLPESGVVVLELQPLSPAHAAGLRPTEALPTRYGLLVVLGDIITAVNHTPIGSFEQLIEEVHKHAPGDTLTLTVRRAGEVLDLSVRLGA